MARRHVRSSRSRMTGNRGRRAQITATVATPSRCPRRALPRIRKRIACRAPSRSARRSRSGPGARPRTLEARGRGPRPHRPRRLEPSPPLPPLLLRIPEPAATRKTTRPRSAPASRCRSRTHQSGATRRAIGRHRRRGRRVAPEPQAAGDRTKHEDRWRRQGRRSFLPVGPMRVEDLPAAPPIASRLAPPIRPRC